MSTKRHPASSRPFLSLLFVVLGGLASALRAPSARAAPPTQDDESPELAPRLERFDVAPHELWTANPSPDRPGARPPLWLAVEATVSRLVGGERSYGAMLLASVPLERLADRAPRVGALSPPIGAGAAPRLEPPPRPPKRPKDPPADSGAGGPSSRAEAPLEAPNSVAPPALPVRLTPEVARAAVHAALRRANIVDPEARVDGLASRARASAVLPELRLRVTRLIDDAQSLSPTEYDPARTTATGGVSLWLEARATWRLDRLVFADEEVAFERLRRDRAEAQSKLAARVLELLFAWQRALAREADLAGRAPKERLAATLDVIEAEASLDIVTDGWFTRWRASPTGRARGDAPGGG